MDEQKTSIVAGTISPRDIFMRQELPRLEAATHQALVVFGKHVARLRAILGEGMTLRSLRGPANSAGRVTPEQMRDLAPETVAELETILDKAAAFYAAIGAERMIEPRRPDTRPIIMTQPPGADAPVPVRLDSYEAQAPTDEHPHRGAALDLATLPEPEP